MLPTKARTKQQPNNWRAVHWADLLGVIDHRVAGTVKKSMALKPCLTVLQKTVKVQKTKLLRISALPNLQCQLFEVLKEAQELRMFGTLSES